MIKKSIVLAVSVGMLAMSAAYAANNTTTGTVKAPTTKAPVASDASGDTTNDNANTSDDDSDSNADNSEDY